MSKDEIAIDTLAVHGGEPRPALGGAVVFPIVQSTVFEDVPGADYHDIRYIRLNSTPTQRYLHDKLAALEGAEAAVAATSGMAAISAALLACVRAGDHVLAPSALYGGTHDLLAHDLAELGIGCTFVDPTDPGAWERARRPETRVFLAETIGNPLLRVPRLRELVAFARAHGLVTIVDNTLASPVNCRPLALGVDLVVHSATKYLNGHSDLVAGCAVGATELVERVRRKLNHLGGSLDPHAAFLLARGLKTLALRVRAQNANALAVARFLEAHRAVAEVHYPGLPSHPDHAHARELLAGFGGLLSFRLRGGASAAEALLARVRLPYVAVSLGGVETLITRPALTSHAGMSPEARARAGVHDDLVRLACGIEAAEDLVADLGRALEGA